MIVSCSHPGRMEGMVLQPWNGMLDILQPVGSMKCVLFASDLHLNP